MPDSDHGRRAAGIAAYAHSRVWHFSPKGPSIFHLVLLFLEDEAPGAPWMIAGLGVDIRPLIPEAVRRGGHVRVGLEDAPFGCPMTSRALVEEAVELIRANGAEPATVAEMRAALTKGSCVSMILMALRLRRSKAPHRSKG